MLVADTFSRVSNSSKGRLEKKMHEDVKSEQPRRNEGDVKTRAEGIGLEVAGGGGQVSLRGSGKRRGRTKEPPHAGLGKCGWKRLTEDNSQKNANSKRGGARRKEKVEEERRGKREKRMKSRRRRRVPVVEGGKVEVEGARRADD